MDVVGKSISDFFSKKHWQYFQKNMLNWLEIKEEDEIGKWTAPYLDFERDKE
jgi:hypothetical protein